MANAPDSSSYVLANSDASLGNSRVLEAGIGLEKQDTGVGGTFTIAAGGNLATLATTTTSGYIVCDTSGGGPIFVQRGLNAGTGITINNGFAQDGSTTISVTPKSTTQNVEVSQNGTLIATRNNLNFTSSGPLALTVQDDGLDDRVNINVDGSSIAGNDATYIIQTPDATLPNAQALSSLDTGLMKVTTSTGVVSTAKGTNDFSVPNAGEADFQTASVNLSSIYFINSLAGVLPQGVSAGDPDVVGFVGLSPGSENQVLTSHGPGELLTWETPTSGSGAVVVVNNSTPTPINIQNNTTYLVDSSSLTTFLLPNISQSQTGSFFKIKGCGITPGNWVISQANCDAGQVIRVGSPIVATTPGTSGSISSNNWTDSIMVYCFRGAEGKYTADISSGQVTVS